MTRLTPDEKCAACEGLLVPPELAPDFKIPAGADYVCLNCGRPYRWVGNPPRLTLLVVADRRDDDGDDDG